MGDAGLAQHFCCHMSLCSPSWCRISSINFALPAMRAGYNIRRKNFAAAAVKRDKLYTIAAR